MEDIKVVTTEDFLVMSLEQRRDYYYSVYQKAGELALLVPNLTMDDIEDFPAAFMVEFGTYIAASQILEGLLNFLSSLFEQSSERLDTSL